MEHTSSEKIDVILAASLVASPAWAAWLGSFAEFLTSLTLLCGAVLGVCRLWIFLKRLRDEAEP